MDQPNNNQNQFSPPAYTPPPADPQSMVVTPSSGEKTSEKKPIKMNKTIIIAGVFLLLLAGTVFGLNKFTGLFSKATGDCLPENLKETDLTANSADITFSTGKTCLVEIAYGTSNNPEALLLQVPEKMASLNHRIRLSPLLPSTTYYYQVKSEGKAVGTIRSFLTLATSGGTAVAPTKSQSATAPTVIPTTVPTTITVSPAVSPATSSGTAKTYVFEDFQAKFGSADKTFDLDKNGVVNSLDWFLYNK